MNFNYYKIEMAKYNKFKMLIFYLFVLMASISFVAVTINNQIAVTDTNKIFIQWYKIFDSYFFSRVILYPIIISSLASRVISVENENNMWNIICASGIKLELIHKIKFMYVFEQLLILQVLEWACIFIISLSVGISGQIPYYRLFVYFFSQLAISTFLMALHYILSLKWKNQLISVSAAILGSLTGLICVFLPKIFSVINPYSWYSNLLSVNFVRSGDKFIENLRDINYMIIFLALICSIIAYKLIFKIERGD